ncbi:hypothetical protein D3C78_903420 [compost metagenome]
MPGNLQLLVGRTHLGVGPHDIGDQGDPCGVRRRLGRIGIGLGRFDPTLQGAEQVELIGGGDTDVPNVGHRDFFRQQKRFARLLQTLGTEFHPTAPTARRLGLFHLRTGAGQVGRRHSQIGVGGHGLAHQFIQAWIPVQPPPVARYRSRHHVPVVGRQVALEVLAMHRRLLRQLVIRAHRLTGGQQ